MDELRGVVQFDFIGVSLRDQDSDTFQNYFIDNDEPIEFVPEEKLAPEERLRIGLRASRTPAEGRRTRWNRAIAGCKDFEKAAYSLGLRAPIDDSAPQTGSNHFLQQAGRYLFSPNDIRFVSQVAELHCAGFRRRIEF